MTNKLRISIKENTALLTIDNPPANTWDLESLNFLEESVKELNNNKEIFSLIITGEGEKFFSAGADLKGPELCSKEPQGCLHLVHSETAPVAAGSWTGA